MLTPEKIRELWENYSPTKGIESFARSVETEVSKDYDALIRQMLEALEASEPSGKVKNAWVVHSHAITAARARLEKAP
jgi:hypothetical protein